MQVMITSPAMAHLDDDGQNSNTHRQNDVWHESHSPKQWTATPFKCSYTDQFSNFPGGLFGFAFACFIGGCNYLHLTHSDNASIAVFFIIGGVLQYIIGIYDFFKGHTIGSMLFITFGIYNMNFLGFYGWPKLGIVPVMNGICVGYYKLIFVIYVIFITIGAIPGSKVLLVDLIIVTVLLFFQTIYYYSGNSTCGKINGAWLWIAAPLTVYIAFSKLALTIYGENYLPLITTNEVTYWKKKNDKAQKNI